MSDAAVQVRLLRHRTTAADPLADRLRLGSLLARVEVRPASLPPSAVLCVRRLDDPLPGRLPSRPGEVRSPPEWERAAAEALENELRGAARPAREAVPASANAVLFADRAELLACLAADWLSGELVSRWWWAGILAREPPPRTAVVAAWAEAPRYVPAALDLLAARGQAIAFVQLLAAEEAAALAAAAATAFALPALAAAAETVTAPPQLTHAAASPVALPPVAPWYFVAPETTGVALEPARELLLGIALALRRAPVAARARAFADAVRSWQAAVAEERAAPVRPLDGRPPQPEATWLQPAPLLRAPPRPAPAPLAAPPPPAAAGTAPTPPVPRIEDAPSPAVARSSEAPARPAHVPELPRRAAPGPETTPAAGPEPRAHVAEPRVAGAPQAAPAKAQPSAVRPSPVPREPARAQADQLRAQPEAPEQAEAVEAVDTELGGLFFLANLALYLGLLADFSAPEDTGIGLDPWDLVALLGQRLLDEPSRDDAVWALLARLAGRDEREPPGREFAPPEDWRVPPQWLAPWPPGGEWTWSRARGRLRVRHPAGFLVLDVADGEGAFDPYASLEPYAALAPRLQRARVPGDGARGRPATRWAHRLATYARPRLALALGLDDPAAAPRLLLRRPARVLVTTTHVDVVLRLAHHPLEIRLAGLDRDPGWIPAAGRFLAFRFE